MSYELIGAVGVGIVGQTPPGLQSDIAPEYLLRYFPFKGGDDTLVYDLSGNGRHAKINGSIVVNTRTITSTLTQATAWGSAAGLTTGSTTGQVAVLDPSFLSNWRPDQGDSLFVFAKVYIPAVPPTGSTVALFGAMGRNATAQSNGFRFALACSDNALPRTILFTSYDGTGGAKYSGNSSAQVTPGADNTLAWYIEPQTMRVTQWVNGVKSIGGTNNFYARNFLDDIMTKSTVAQTPAFGLNTAAFDLGVGVSGMVIKQLDMAVVKNRAIANPDACESKLRALSGMYLTSKDLA